MTPRLEHNDPAKAPTETQLDRQQFLGSNSDGLLARLTIGVVGAGGGGSHILQQLAHIGFGNIRIFDPQQISQSNLNRLVGGTDRDVRHGRRKADIARRVIRGVSPAARVRVFPVQWQYAAEALRDCDLVVGCVDSYAERDQLELQARRYLLPYVDIGMDVTLVEAGRYAISGQVILSLPGHPCMRCMGFLRDNLLAEEAAQYGAAGPRPQVVWPNGVLASTAVGILMQLVLPWDEGSEMPAYLEYDGNLGTVTPSRRLEYVPTRCSHFDGLEHLGDTWFSLTGATRSP